MPYLQLKQQQIHSPYLRSCKVMMTVYATKTTTNTFSSLSLLQTSMHGGDDDYIQLSQLQIIYSGNVDYINAVQTKGLF